MALVFLLMPFFCMANQAESAKHHCITRFENGAINWTTGNISAIGKATPEDNRDISQESVPGSARADANRQIIEILKQIKINNALSVEAYASKNDIILAGMEKTARDATLSKQYYTSALSVEITIETSMFGGFLQLVLPEEIRQISQISPEISRKKSTANPENLYTGLIIDARGLGVESVLNPVIVSEQGHDVYSSSFISREFAVQNGVCKYICDMDQALKGKRIGNHPLVFKGLRKEGKQNTVIVISMSDYGLLEKVSERHQFLKECRVVIVQDQ
ncbi:MAG: hypothetical protein KKE44_18510 [Proteobacteria bacterium]|nr:hypothetical protein [Pseudomonadota bacterium]MBU1584726.1 hypothetical protein [Pseudomonadota bacterium]MBU2452573.1 hypothetical protein [Pseudomonadota bacterium]MBU2629654.1 hypothetical protein [Pseudomonadota bacterium]